jgi:hypothetical protein
LHSSCGGAAASTGERSRAVDRDRGSSVVHRMPCTADGPARIGQDSPLATANPHDGVRLPAAWSRSDGASLMRTSMD